ncbi:MAG: DUF3604 domain-containing protein [Halioglobus sp.]
MTNVGFTPAFIKVVVMRSACSQFFLSVFAGLFCICPIAGADTTNSEEGAPFLLSEGRTPCAEHSPLKKAYFGDLHIHTRWSLDAYMQGARMQPSDAYKFAKGESLSLPTTITDGDYVSPGSLARPRLTIPLDFAAVTDHAEMFGEQQVCETPSAPGYGNWRCQVYRRFPAVALKLFMGKNSEVAEPGQSLTRFSLCGVDDEDCASAAESVWQITQDAAQDAYDQSPECNFTSLIGYEWSSTPNTNNLHRVVLFRNQHVPGQAVDSISAPTPEQLWDGLERDCLTGTAGCDAITIAHNANMSGGRMFDLTQAGGDLPNAAAARQRQRMEPLVEIFQRKGDSECAAGGVDELCNFEKFPWSNMMQDKLGGFLSEPPPPSNYVRYALKEGIATDARIGVNPLRLGFIGSTDTHMGLSGGVEESTYPGHGGQGNSVRAEPGKGLTDKPRYNPGGLAVIWAEENSRDALFSAMKRRETYGTSGPRITLRTFGGWDFDETMCGSRQFLEQGYRDGVPMGSDLPPRPEGDSSPVFAISALASPEGGELQQIQVVKGWVEDGRTHEAVVSVVGSADNGASVDLRSCEPRGSGYQSLCKVWQDPEFNPSQHAFYYARVVENPSCRWSTWQCLDAGVQCDGGSVPASLEACCDDQLPKTVQERAWSSPIWYRPSPALPTQANKTTEELVH